MLKRVKIDESKTDRKSCPKNIFEGVKTTSLRLNKVHKNHFF